MNNDDTNEVFEGTAKVLDDGATKKREIPRRRRAVKAPVGQWEKVMKQITGFLDKPSIAIIAERRRLAKVFLTGVGAITTMQVSILWFAESGYFTTWYGAAFAVVMSLVFAVAIDYLLLILWISAAYKGTDDEANDARELSVVLTVIMWTVLVYIGSEAGGEVGLIARLSGYPLMLADFWDVLGARLRRMAAKKEAAEVSDDEYLRGEARKMVRKQWEKERRRLERPRLFRKGNLLSAATAEMFTGIVDGTVVFMQKTGDNFDAARLDEVTAITLEIPAEIDDTSSPNIGLVEGDKGNPETFRWVCATCGKTSGKAYPSTREAQTALRRHSKTHGE